MSHHHRNIEKATTEEKTLQRRHSHHDHSHLRTGSVIDQLKTKVKRKRLSKQDLADSSDMTSIQSENINNNSNIKHSVEPTHHRSTTAVDLHPTVLSTIFSYDGTESEMNSNNEISIENNKQNLFISTPVPHNNDVEETVRWRTNPITFDASERIYRVKLKPIKTTKSLPEMHNVPNLKKRRQTVRRMGFQIRDEDFNIIFSDLSPNEQLVIGFSCAWRKDVFMHGRMFLSVNYLCFYTCFFKWEESLCIAYKDIVSVTREKSVKLLPNAIKIRTQNNEQFFFASTLPREKIFIAIFRLWQNALLEQPLDYQYLRALVFADQQQNPDESSVESEESVSLGHTTPPVQYSQSLPIRSNRSSDPTIQSIRTDHRVVSLPTDNKNVNYLSSCTCENHLAKTYADRLFTFSVGTLFELLFSDNSFTRDFHNTQKLTDYNYGEWRLNKETGHRERQVTYKTVTQSILGTNSLSCREKQTLEIEESNLIYVLSSEVYNEGMKYTDTFYVATRFCMTQRDAEHCSLLATAEVRYIKSVNSFIKSFIEKNAYSSIEDGINEQVRRLESRQVNFKSNEEISLPSKQLRRRRRRRSINDEQSLNQTQDHSNTVPESKEKSITGHGFLYDIALFIGIFFLLVHIYLCYKLYSLDQIIPTPETICFNQCLQTCSGNKPNS